MTVKTGKNMSKPKILAFIILYYIVATAALAEIAVTIRPAIGTEVLQNGGFETGDISPWEITSSGTNYRHLNYCYTRT